METFSDVLHKIIDHVFSGDVADKAHAVIDRTSGPRTPEEAPAQAAEPVTEAPAPEQSDPTDQTETSPT